MTYYEMLKDPRWQKKRLEIMERDEFACQSCEDKDSTLNVHHAYYEKGKKPWEYPDSSLVTWCESCHKERHKQHNEILRNISRLKRKEYCGLINVLRFGAGVLDSLQAYTIHVAPREKSKGDA